MQFIQQWLKTDGGRDIVTVPYNPQKNTKHFDEIKSVVQLEGHKKQTNTRLKANESERHRD